MKISRVLFSFIAVVVVGAMRPAHAETILTWTFPVSSQASQVADSANANLDSGGGYNLLSRGAGAPATTGAGFRTTGFQNNGIDTANADYFQIFLSAANGYALSLSGITGGYVGTGTFSADPGVSHQWAYSFDGTSFSLIGDATTRIGNGSSSFDFSGVSALQNIAAGTDVTLRYYASGQTTTGGWGFSSQGFTVDGTLSVAGFSVGFDKTSGFEVEEGSSDTITATAMGGTEPYSYTWTSSLNQDDYTAALGVFTIEDTAPTGDYWAQVIATDNSAASVTNTINFSVVPPTVKYAITVAETQNGTATTTPADEAEAGATVTVNTSPASGYAVESIVVNGGAVTVTGNTFTMPAQAVTVTVTFMEAATSGALIISQYYEGARFDKWIEIYNPGSVAIDLAGGEFYLGLWANINNRELWKTGGAPSFSMALTGSIPPGGTYLLSHLQAALPTYATAAQANSQVINFNADDSVVLYTGATYAFANVVDAFGMTASNAMNTSFVRKNTITTGVNTDFNAADWDEFSNTAVDSAAAGTNERLGYHSTGPVVFGVTFDKSEGFTIEEGTSDTITATAANGTAPYSYTWTSSLNQDDYTAALGVFTIEDTAPTGDYWAQVIATDNSAASVTNTINFSVVPPAVKYTITVAETQNGSATTTPADEAEAGATVTINATPSDGYVVDAYSVVGADTTVIGTSSSFVMPGQAVTVTVTFKEHTGSSLIISEVTDPQDNANAKFVELYNAGGSAVDLAAGQWHLARQANGSTWANVALTGTVAPAGKYVIIYSASNFAAAYPGVTPDQTAGSVVTGNGDDGYFLYSGGDNTAGILEDVYGVLNEDGTGMTWEYTDGRAVRNTGITVGNPTWTAGEWTITRPEIAANMTPSVHPDGPAVLSVSFDKAEGFQIAEGAGAAITANAVNGTAPYTYAWTSSMQPADYAAVDNVFTINAAAPTGTYWAQVVATDNAAASVTNTINFSIVVVSDTATLPINESYTATFDWTTLPGWTGVGMTTYSDGDMSFNANGDMLTVKFDAAPDELSFSLQGRDTTAGTAPMNFVAEESADGTTWTPVETIDESVVSTSQTTFGPYALLAASRYVRWNYVNKYAFNLGLNNVVITSSGAPVPTVVISGDLSVTVNEEMSLTITLQNGTATEWWIDLTDPDAIADNSYGWVPATGAFTLTPTKVGNYTLTATAVDGDLNPIDSDTVTIEVSPASGNPPIVSITFIAGTGFSFQVPEGYTLYSVEGASALSGDTWAWTTLSSPTDYTVSGSTITILRAPADKRMIRIWVTPAP
ncbi:MAG TPA: lamin tail domain-containing protein [Kiritimatiellia bacterium]|nr:lamin tail domain-containing protein [Kiritimatiellia bacterium]